MYSRHVPQAASRIKIYISYDTSFRQPYMTSHFIHVLKLRFQDNTRNYHTTNSLSDNYQSRKHAVFRDKDGWWSIPCKTRNKQGMTSEYTHRDYRVHHTVEAMAAKQKLLDNFFFKKKKKTRRFYSSQASKSTKILGKKNFRACSMS